MKKIARTAGLLYLIVIVTGAFSLAYVPSQIGLHGEAASVAEHLSRSQALYRLGIVAGMACNLAFLLLPLALYRLLAPAGQQAAALMVALAAVSVPIAFVNLIHQLDALTVIEHLGRSGDGPAAPWQAQLVLQLEGYRHGLLVLEVFWGLWLLPFGYLVYRCGFLPRVLGVLLMLGCAGYLADVLGTLLRPAYPASTAADYVTLPASLGELGACLWLLLVGARPGPRASLTRARDPGNRSLTN